jgi:hypothetical protein
VTPLPVADINTTSFTPRPPAGSRPDTRRSPAMSQPKQVTL